MEGNRQAHRLDPHLLEQALLAAQDGIVICDARATDMPLIYVNPGFERLTGYGAEEVVGRNCRFLQRDDQDQDGLTRLRRSLEAGEGCSVVLRNYRADGSLFWNELSISPVHDAEQRISHYVGIQKDVTARIQSEERLRRQGSQLRRANRELTRLATHDTLTGLYNRRYFHQHLERQWRVCRRQGFPLSVFLADVDAFKRYNDSFGHPAGDACLCRVASALQGAFRRPADVVARYGGEEFIAIAVGMSVGEAEAMAEQLRRRVEDLQLPAPGGGQVTISVGVASAHPDDRLRPQDLVAAADRELYAAKAAGRNIALHRYVA